MTEAATIASLRRIGLAGVYVTCARADCLHAKAITWTDLGLPEETRIPEIAGKRRFVCAACGSRRVTVTPDWRAYHPQGGG